MLPRVFGKKLLITLNQGPSVIKPSIITEKPLSYDVSQSDSQSYNTAPLETIKSILNHESCLINVMQMIPAFYC